MIGPEQTAARLVGDWPGIGIRLVVDGRQYGVRASPEAETRGMALPTAALIRDTQRGPDGFPIDVVDPDRDIGGVHEAADVAVSPTGDHVDDVATMPRNHASEAENDDSPSAVAVLLDLRCRERLPHLLGRGARCPRLVREGARRPGCRAFPGNLLPCPALLHGVGQQEPSPA
jgi:hypothetical protein